MYLIVKDKVLEKSKVAACFSFTVGIVFLFGLLIDLLNALSFSFLIKQISQITCQMNLLALFVSSLYLFKPNHRFFENNLLVVFSTIMLWFVGLGFWLILFPIYYINLVDFLIPKNDIRSYYFSIFYAIWNHTITPIFFLVFFYYTSKKSNLYYLAPINIKSVFFVLFCYSIIWITLNIFISFSENVFPTYGILTNFNPYTKFVSEKHGTALFSVKYLIASHIACLSLGCILTLFFSLMSIKFGIINQYRLTNKIIKNSFKSIKGFS